jgi:hypothetical protein
VQALAAQGFAVYAVGFPQKQGDNLLWAQAIHDALAVVRAKTGASEVDVVGWSKGAFAARAYVSGIHAPWGAVYAGGVRRLVLIGGPNRGFDYPFRHGAMHDVSIFHECGLTVNAPSPHTDAFCLGGWTHHPELSEFATPAGDFYAGQRQMLARFDDEYPLGVTDQDWWTTYYGGQGFVSRGDGIAAALGDSLVGRIRDAGVPASIPTYFLCGAMPSIPTIHDEHTGPSDGVLFTDSCLDTGGIGTIGDTALFPELNHLELGWAPQATARVAAWLAR